MAVRFPALMLLILAPGCRMPAPPAPTPVHSRPSDAGKPAESFTIVFTTFIPGNHLYGPALHPQSYTGILPPRRLVFAGDDSGSTFRARQVVTVVADSGQDHDGLVEGSMRNIGGVTESFVAQDALADGRIDDTDRAACMRGMSAVATTGMAIEGPLRRGPKRVFVRLRTLPFHGPTNRLVLGAPAIDWDLGITIDTSGAEPVYEVAGTWDGYPAAELTINGQPVYSFRPERTRDLVKLLPLYGDVRVDTRGTLRPSAGFPSEFGGRDAR